MFKVLLPIIIFLVFLRNDKMKEAEKRKKNKKLIAEDSDLDQFVELFKNQWENKRAVKDSKTLSQALHDRGLIRNKNGNPLDEFHRQKAEDKSIPEMNKGKGQISEAIDDRRKDVRLAREKYNRDFLGEDEREKAEEETFAYEIIDLEEENPWVEGIILSEILGKPKAMRK